MSNSAASRSRELIVPFVSSGEAALSAFNRELTSEALLNGRPLETKPHNTSEVAVL